MTQESDNKTVIIGIAVGFVATLFLFIVLFSIVPKTVEEVILAERLKLGIASLVFPGAFLLLMVLRVGSQRFGNESENPIKLEANSEGMKIDIRVLANSHEQLTIFAINTLALSVLLPFQYLSLVPIYSVVFVIGRLIFWVTYRKNFLWRAPGFAMSTLPAVVGFGYCCFLVLSSIFANA